MKKRKAPNSKYKPSMCDTVIEVAKRGGFHAAMMLELGVGHTAFYNYIQRYPEFAAAVERADLIIQAKNESILSEIAENKSAGDFKATSYILQTKFAKEYARERMDMNAITANNITINNLTLTSEERDYKIAQLSEKLRSAGYDLSALLNPTTRVIEEIPTDDHPDD